MNEQKKEIQNEIGKHSAIEAVRISEGGQLLMKAYAKDILSCINSLISTYTTATHTEMIGYSAKLAERLAIYNTLNRSTKNKKIALADLNEIIKLGEEE